MVAINQKAIQITYEIMSILVSRIMMLILPINEIIFGKIFISMSQTLKTKETKIKRISPMTKSSAYASFNSPDHRSQTIQVIDSVRIQLLATLNTNCSDPHSK